MRRSGSWFSNAWRRRCAFSQTQPTGSIAPPARPRSEISVDDAITVISSPTRMRGADHHVGELRRLQRQVGALDEAPEAEPETRFAERVLREAEQAGERLETLLLLLRLLDRFGFGATCRCTCGAHPVGARGREDENERQEHEQADEQPKAHRAAPAVGGRRQQPAGLLHLRRRGDRGARGVSAEPGHLRDELRRLSRPTRRDVVEAPRALQLVSELGVDALESSGRRRAVVPASRSLGEVPAAGRA